MRRPSLLLLTLLGCTPMPQPENPPAAGVESLVQSAYPVLLRFAGADSAAREFLVLAGDSEFDRSVAGVLERSPERLPVADSVHAFWIGTRGVRYLADSAVVIVEYGRCERDRDELNWWHNTDELIFTGTEGEWQFVRSRSIRNSDGVCGAELLERMEEEAALDPEP